MRRAHTLPPVTFLKCGIYSQHNLFTAIESEVRDLQDPETSLRGTFVRVNWGDLNEIPNDTQDPNQVMEWLDRRGIIQHEYSKVKQMMENARNLDMVGRDEEG